MSPSPSPRRTVHTHPDLEALSRAAARALHADVDDVLADRDRYSLALAGGSTPRRLYELLAEDEPDALPWGQIHLFWGDERFVPPDHPKSNARMAGETLVRHVQIPQENVHPIPTETNDPTSAARAYTETLQHHFPGPSQTFDLALLGLGADGHTASLFPTLEQDSPAEDEWVRVVQAPPEHDVSTRITCTLPVLNGARRTVFLVAGERKRDALAAVLDGDRTLPASHVQPRQQLDWYVDEHAFPGSPR